MFLFFSTVKWACLCDKLKLRTIWSHVISCRCRGQVNPSVVSILGFCLLVGTVSDLSSVVQFWACAECGSLCISDCANSPKRNSGRMFLPHILQLATEQPVLSACLWAKAIPSWQRVVEFIPIELDRSWKENISVSTLCDPGHSAVLFYKFKG